jgi:hypothetical protein
VTVLATVEAALAATAASAAVATSAALLAPADSNRAATNLVTIEVRDSLLSVLFLVEVDETEGSLYVLMGECDCTLRRTWQEPILVKISSNSPGSMSLGTLPMNRLIVIL